MSQERVELVRKVFAAHEVGGIEMVLAFYASDVRMYLGQGWVEDPVYCGHDGVRALDALFAHSFDDWGWEVHEIRDAGERVVAFVEMTGRIKDSGAPIRMTQVLVASDFRAETIAELRFFNSWNEACEAVDLKE